jgi:hypothetical protein
MNPIEVAGCTAGGEMKRISIVVVLMVVAAACGVPAGGGAGGGGSGGGFTTVSGRIVRRDTGQPYPGAYVRFGWLVSTGAEQEAHAVTGRDGTYAIPLPAGQYQVTAGDSCDLNAGFAIAGRAPDDVMITVPGTDEVDFVEYPITPGADLPGVC